MLNRTEPTPLSALREAHLRDYWKVAWQGRWTVLAVFLVVVAAVGTFSVLRTPVYRSTAVIEVQPQAKRITPGQDVSGIGAAGYGWFAEEKYHNTQVEIIRSRDVATRVFHALDLASDPDFKDLKDPIDALRRMIQVEPRRETGLIEISMAGADRNRITRLVNAVADAYVQRNLEKAKENVRQAVDAIREQLSPLQAGLSEAEERRFEVLNQTEIYNPENQAEVVRQKLTKYNAELASNQIEVNRLHSLLTRLQDLQSSGTDPMSLPELSQDPVLQDLNRQKVELERQLETAKVTLKPGNPAYQEKVSQLDTVRQRIREQVGLTTDSLRNQYALATRQETYLKGEIKRAEEESFAIGQATSRYDIVKTDSETKKRIYDLVTKTMNEVALGAQLLSNNVAVLDYATPPLYPIRPRKRVDLAVGGIVGLMLGIGLVFFLDYLDNTLRTPEDIERYLGLSVLAVVPRIRENVADQRAVREAYQTLRTSVTFSSRNRERKVLLVTSTQPREGKSSTVASLAKAFAAAGDRVVLVDCDLRRPTIHEHTGVGRDHGLTNYLAAREGQAAWRDFLKPLQPDLDVITCGPIPPSPPDLLGGERFSRLLSELRAGYDWVVLDSPPAGSLADASLLAALADMVVIVVRHNTTDRDLVRRTIQGLGAVNPAVVGVVLNNVDLKGQDKDYYHAGYYYGGEPSESIPASSPPESGRGPRRVRGVGP